MPQDPNLYGQRPAKRQKKEIPLSSSLDFTSQLTSLLSTSSNPSSSSAVPGRARPSKKDDIFSVKAKRKAGSSTTATAADSKGNGGSSKDGKIQLKEVRGTEEEKQNLARARRKMEEKARLYAAMKRGDYIAKDGETAPLVDFDRKWAEKHPDEEDDDNGYSSSGTDNESDAEAQQETIEFKDEFGRTRRGTRAEMERLQRRSQRAALGAAELEHMAAKPVKAPERLIYGDVIQSAAFNPEDDTARKMQDLADKRDREPTPPPDTHFDGGAEIRTKGVGFYQFSRDEDRRKEEMAALGKERDNTEQVRREREALREKRRREIEERRAKIGKKRADKLAESFLDGLAGEMGTAAASGMSSTKEKGPEGKKKQEEVTSEKSSS
ncbi:hypothetical protein F4819DRAFT_453677 [Hypoxylon fuscum]|nr:hypothetical protein F4819DRAFT_453677 [Hypoxylon fuscum]